MMDELTRWERKWGKDVTQRGIATTPEVVLKHAGAVGMTPAETGLVAQVSSFKWDERRPFVSSGTIAKRMGVTRQEVQHLVASLRKKGLVVRGGTERRPSEWNLNPLIRKCMKLEAQEREKQESSGEEVNHKSPLETEEEEKQDDSGEGVKYILQGVSNIFYRGVKYIGHESDNQNREGKQTTTSTSREYGTTRGHVNNPVDAVDAVDAAADNVIVKLLKKRGLTDSCALMLTQKYPQEGIMWCIEQFDTRQAEGLMMRSPAGYLRRMIENQSWESAPSPIEDWEPPELREQTPLDTWQPPEEREDPGIAHPSPSERSGDPQHISALLQSALRGLDRNPS